MMVVLRTVVLVWLGVVPATLCLPLDGGRSNELRPLTLPEDLDPKDLTQKNLHDLLPDDLAPQDELNTLARSHVREPSGGSLRSYDDTERALLRKLANSSPFLYQLPEALSESAVGAPFRDGAPALAVEDTAEGADWGVTDPRYYLLEYLNQGNEDNLDSLRFNRPGRSKNTSSDNNNNLSTTKAKKTWPHGMSRRRASGLSLSIDASMKVLREAMYLELARKKQRQQMQRARQNQALLTTIGKRDVQQQARETELASGNREH